MTEEKFAQCMKRICEGDRMGLKDIYEEYLPYLYRTVYSIVQKKEIAEDVTSDFFVKLWSLAPKYQPGNGHKGYLAAIARNMAIDQMRKYGREIPTEDVELHVCREHSSDAPKTLREDGDMEAKGVLAAKTGGSALGEPSAKTPEEQVVEKLSVKEALDRLKPAERQIIDMKVLGEMTFHEISQLLGVPMGTVTWRYQEGIKKLRRYGYE